ncbi:MAG: lysophospholipid acyltransferase family protein [Pseudomonadota bacterium]
MIRSTIMTVWFYSFSFIVAMLCWIIALVSTRKAMWHLLRFWGKTNLFMIRLIMKSRVEVRGAHNLKPGTAQLIVSKHQSELDIVMLGAAMWDVSAIAMLELTKLPFFGTILKKIDAVTIAVDEGPQGRTQQAIDGATRIRDQQRQLVIYPEGELMQLGAKERYRSGVGRIYEAIDVEVVPVAVSLGVIWPQRQFRKHANVTGVMEFMEPIQPGLSFEAFMEELENRIETRTMELIEECASGEVLEAARDRYARGVNNHDKVADAA